jgi:hypothetical protein
LSKTAKTKTRLMHTSTVAIPGNSPLLFMLL